MRFSFTLPMISLFSLGCPTDVDKDDTAGGGGGGGGEDRVDECNSTACGGDVVGAWTYAGMCIDTSQSPIEGCTGGYTQYSEVTMSGTLDFSADGTYALAFGALSNSMLFHLPYECLDGSTCDEAAASFGGADCVDTGDACDCTFTNEGEPSEATGTWTVDGSTLSMLSDGGTQTTADFCADADEMWMLPDTNEPSTLVEGILFTR